MTIRVITPPTVEPVTLAEVKAQCRIDGTEEDVYLGALIAAAREYCELYSWRSYLTQTIELWLTDWPSADEIELPRPPVQSVVSVEYYDTADVKYTLAATDYYADVITGAIHLKFNKGWPSVSLRDYSAVCITYQAGEASAELVPPTVKQAMLLLIGHWYENREAVLVGTISKSLEFTVKALLDINRKFAF